MLAPWIALDLMETIDLRNRMPSSVDSLRTGLSHHGKDLSS